MQPQWFGEEEIRSRVDMPAAIEAMRSAFLQLSSGEAEIPVRTSVEGGGTTGLFMPGWLPAEGALGAKVVTVRPSNAGTGRPVVQALVLVLDVETGAPRAVMDGTWLTALRTGAASGLATELLARPEAGVLAVVGAGGQARAQIEGVLAARPIREVRIRSRGMDSARALARALDAEGLVNRSGGAVRFTTEPDPLRQLAGAHVIVTATDSAEPILPDQLPAGCHVNAVGAYTGEMREIPAEALRRARVFVDQVEAARSEAGDLIRAAGEGAWSWDQVAGEVGQVIAGGVEGRRSADEVTVFKSVGSAAQDLAVAHAVLRGDRG
jgi:ornithine cyclodeaminase